MNQEDAIKLAMAIMFTTFMLGFIFGATVAKGL